jgi:superfamily II DNA/RNA helicase
MSRLIADVFQVLDLHKIKCIELNGKMSPSARNNALTRFRRGGRDDARVLILSMVGTSGLNIAFANLLIMMVCRHFVWLNVY